MKKIELSRGQFAFVDDGDFDQLNEFSWWMDAYGYACRHSSGPHDSRETIRMHRQIMGIGRDQTLHVDHKNGLKTDNQKENLRICSPTENARNRPAQANNKSGLKGVSPMRDKWQAQISVNRKKIWLGMYKTKELAHEAYKKAAIEHFGEFAKF